MARIVGDRPVERLERSGFIIMKRPPAIWRRDARARLREELTNRNRTFLLTIAGKNNFQPLLTHANYSSHMCVCVPHALAFPMTDFLRFLARLWSEWFPPEYDSY